MIRVFRAVRLFHVGTVMHETAILGFFNLARRASLIRCHPAIFGLGGADILSGPWIM
jgi:hypothetical protein